MNQSNVNLNIIDELQYIIKKNILRGNDAVSIDSFVLNEFYSELVPEVAEQPAVAPAAPEPVVTQAAPEVAAPPVMPQTPPPVVEKQPEPVAEVVKQVTKSVQQPKPPAKPVYQDDLSAFGYKELMTAVTAAEIKELFKDGNLAVFGSGEISGKVLFIGEVPAINEGANVLPFLKESGELLAKMITAMKLSTNDIYLTKIIRYGENLAASQPACMAAIEKVIQQMKPQVIVLLGTLSLRFLLNTSGLGKLHGQWHEHNGIPVMPTFHPAYLLRMPARKRDAWSDLQKVMAKLGHSA